MTPQQILESSVASYKVNLDVIVKELGKQVFFIDDSQAMLNLIDSLLKQKFHFYGYIVEPNPSFAKYLLEWLISKNIPINELIKHAVIDVDFGMYSKQVTVNDLIDIFHKYNIPVTLFTALEQKDLPKHVSKGFLDKVSYVSKLDAQAINKIYTLIQDSCKKDLAYEE